MKKMTALLAQHDAHETRTLQHLDDAIIEPYLHKFRDRNGHSDCHYSEQHSMHRLILYYWTHINALVHITSTSTRVTTTGKCRCMG